MAIDAPIHTSQANLQRVLGTGLPVALVFWRRSCAPCDQLSPVLDQLARKYAGRELIVKVNADEEPELLRRYSIRQLPSIVFIKDGQALATATGAAGERELSSWLDYLAGGNGARPPLPSGPSVPVQGAAGSAPPPPRSEPPPHYQGRPAAGAASGAATGEHPMVLTDATFDQVVRSTSLPVLVDCWAPWCGPCKMIAPVVESLAREFAGRAVVGKLNVDENPGVTSRYGIMSIPTLLILRDGQIVDRVVGAVPAPTLRERLVRQLG